MSSDDEDNMMIHRDPNDYNDGDDDDDDNNDDNNDDDDDNNDSDSDDDDDEDDENEVLEAVVVDEDHVASAQQKGRKGAPSAIASRQHHHPHDQHGNRPLHDNNDDEDDDDDTVEAAVIVEEEDDDDDKDEEETVPIPLPKKKKHTPGPKPSAPSTTGKSKSHIPSAKVKTKVKIKKGAAAEKVIVVKAKDKLPSLQLAKSTTKSKKSKKTDAKSSTAAPNATANTTTTTTVVSADPYAADRPPREKIAAARDARAMLQETVPSLPVAVAETQVRSFGRLYIQRDMHNSLFSTTSALYPVGFSCDRFEFSPVHGRLLKMRCSILSGKTIKEKQKALLHQSQSHLNGGVSRPRSDWYDGPVFRVMWGRGIDDDRDTVEYQFDPMIHAKPIFANKQVKSFVEAMRREGSCSWSSNAATKMIMPEPNMRVRVYFAENQYVAGSITSVGQPETYKKQTLIKIQIKYDDGSTETITYPDRDVTLIMPGVEDEIDEEGHVERTRLNGKPVTSVVGLSPIEVWGQVLRELGLIDEIMCENAMKALKTSREESFAEVRDKLEGRIKPKGLGRGGSEEYVENGGMSPLHGDEEREEKKDLDLINYDAPDREPPSEREKHLRSRVEDLLAELEVSQQQDRAAIVELADARIRALGPFMCNPFHDEDSGKAQQSWLATAVRKEKTKMGSTGNRKKVVTALDLLERNDTLFNTDIEALIEGLPGSEFCSSYVFQAFRAAGPAALNRTWIHEAQIRHEKEAMKRQSKVKEIQTKDVVKEKAKEQGIEVKDMVKEEKIRTNEAKIRAKKEKERAKEDKERAKEDKERAREEKERVKEEKERAKEEARERERAKEREKEKIREEQEMLRERKRKEREEERDAKKRQKLEEEEERKRARIDERISRLRTQVNERLFKDATFQREKAIVGLAKGLYKEMHRRRKAAEMVAAQSIVESKASARAASDLPLPFPALAKTYDEDTVRVWNFISTFGDFFRRRNFISEVPSIDSIQRAVDCIRGDAKEGGMSRHDAVVLLTDLSVALCKPLAASLTRVLFASLIALNPALQKDFGAAFFNEVNSSDPMKDNAETLRPDVLLPVNEMTWQEVARLSFLSDALGELGYSRHEVAHVLRGYRSAGHPNSKESKRLRRAEDVAIALLRQEISQCHANTNGAAASDKNRTRVDVPCVPVCSSSQYEFYLHNIRSLDEDDFLEFKSNLSTAIALLETSISNEDLERKKELDRIASLVSDIGVSGHLSKAEDKVYRKAKAQLSQFFEKNAGTASGEYGKMLMSGKSHPEWPWEKVPRKGFIAGNESAPVPLRQQMGLLNTIALSASDLKKLVHERERYMEDALKLKEDMERQKRKDDDDEEDDDEEDEDDENGVVRAEIVENGGDANEDDGKQQISTESDGVSQLAEINQQEPGVIKPDVTPKKIGKETPYDDFCEDIPRAPDVLRRCLAVLRTLTSTGPAEPFLYPVDPQTNPGYYDMVLRPMCLREAGRQLQEAAVAFKEIQHSSEAALEDVVVQFGRNIRLIAQNCLSYANAGPTVISAGVELLRIFERLFFDWALVPDDLLPPLETLDDDRCVEPHASDDEATVLLCDCCEGKYNITRLNPPLREVPKGDWFCPRCVSCRWWGSVDPRVNKKVTRIEGGDGEQATEGIIRNCFCRFPEQPGSKPSLMYQVQYENNEQEIWSLEEIDRALQRRGEQVPAIRFLGAVAESPGYGFGVDVGLRCDLVPVLANPNISDAAAQVAHSSSVFRDTIIASGTLLMIDPREMTSNEWLRLLILLVMKCSSSDLIQNVTSSMESQAALQMTAQLEKEGQVTSIKEILPRIPGTELEEPQEAEDSHDGGIALPPEATKPQERLDKEVEPLTGGVLSTPQNPPVAQSPAEAQPCIVEAMALEVIDDDEAFQTPVLSASIANSLLHIPESIQDRPFFAAYTEKGRRQKAMEDCIAAYCLKNQLRPTIASFEEDSISQVVDATLIARSGFDFSGIRCRRMSCHFCELSDVTLGLPLVRVPNDDEWDDITPHALRSRRTHLVADVSRHSLSSVSGTRKLASVTIRVGGELFSEFDEDLEEIKDGGMLEFLPRSEVGFQDELQFRSNSGLPFVSGSLSAHECCAVAAHNARKEQRVLKHRERQVELIEKDAGMTCGRTLEIGRDCLGRSYWKFNTDQESLFVCDEGTSSGAQWHRFTDPEGIASVMVSLRRDPVVKDLQRCYPEAHRIRSDGTWSSALMKRKFANCFSDSPAKSKKDDSRSPKVVGGLEPYEVGESVLVECESGLMLWDASITGISKRASNKEPESLFIDAYRVQYQGWSTRFCEWVEPVRVVEASEYNRSLQEELTEERASSRFGLPSTLNILIAKDFLMARDRARDFTPLPDFARVAHVTSKVSFSDRTFAAMKAALLAIEAALPIGCVNNTVFGPWRPEYAKQWRRMVQSPTGPAGLMRCVILLEDTISEDWIKEDINNLRSCLPARWKAIAEASPSSLALRILLLDRAIKYEVVDRRRFAKKKRS